MRISDWSSDVCSSDLRIARGDVGTELLARFGVEKVIEAGARRDRPVIATLGTNLQGAFELGAVQHRLAGAAFGPQTFRYIALARATGQPFGSQIGRAHV